MLAHDSIGHEKSETCAVLFGCEVRLEEVMAIVFSHSGAVVGDGEKWRAVAAARVSPSDIVN